MWLLYFGWAAFGGCGSRLVFVGLVGCVALGLFGVFNCCLLTCCVGIVGWWVIMFVVCCW